MALFGKKNDQAEAKKEVVAKAPVRKASVTDANQASVIVGPRITEKAVGKSEQNVYTFVVRQNANKHQIRDAIKATYGVTPVKINTVNKLPAKRMVGMRGKVKHVKGMKKAYVYLKEGDSISIV